MGSRSPLKPRLLTVASAARRLHVRPSTVHELMAIGVLRAYHLGPRLVRIDRRDVDRLARHPMPDLESVSADR